jgi:hypothetical protein
MKDATPRVAKILAVVALAVLPFGCTERENTTISETEIDRPGVDVRGGAPAAPATGGSVNIEERHDADVDVRSTDPGATGVTGTGTGTMGTGTGTIGDTGDTMGTGAGTGTMGSPGASATTGETAPPATGTMDTTTNP